MTKILIADDHQVTRKTLQGILEKNGYRVVTAENGSQAWDLLSGTPDLRLAILDWMMPGMDGVEICRKLREKRRSNFIYIILLTAQEGINKITEALHAGADDYVTKPFDKEELLARLRVGQRIVELQTQLTQAQKLESIGQLAAGIAHEINTPTPYIADNTRFLNVAFKDINRLLAKYKQVLETSRATPSMAKHIAEIDALMEDINLTYLSEEIPNAIQQSLQGVDSVSRIIQAMKVFAHSETEEKIPVDINRAIKSAVMLVRNRWENIAEFVTECDPELPLLKCLPADINQVILNLTTNAAEAVAKFHNDGSKDKGLVKINTRRDNDWIEINISDTGCGIQGDIHDKIFNPFFTTKDIGKETGQGLAISLSIVTDKHNGTITFETQTGKGTTFTIRLPVNSMPNETEMEMAR